ncbi:unnamed protein product [Miscanthus lutarioriparius]|uniref:Uncharacterized protein n=1 Tax=Miscanthus lutarioriparius TaxID=422564 RepID=A0A811MJV6_9POAL|nr:unnamed protein product [Miscanthus lutarioriparius]
MTLFMYLVVWALIIKSVQVVNGIFSISALSLSYIFNWEPIMLQIYVSELNYVLDQNKPQNDADSTSPPSMPSVTPQMQKENECIGRLRLWLVFFANPYEWWDNRQSKPWPTYPDFKHKDTREKIWLRPDDPPWVRKQLELHDLEVAENGHRGNSRLLKSQNWKAQDFDYSDDVQHCAEA